MSQEQARAAVIIALISEKNKSRKKEEKRKICVNPWLKDTQKAFDHFKNKQQKCMK